MTKQKTHAENFSTIFFICLVAGEREKPKRVGGGKEGGRVGEKDNSGKRQEWRHRREKECKRVGEGRNGGVE